MQTTESQRPPKPEPRNLASKPAAPQPVGCESGRAASSQLHLSTAETLLKPVYKASQSLNLQDFKAALRVRPLVLRPRELCLALGPDTSTDLRFCDGQFEGFVWKLTT